jgi:hypothetical protein
MDFSLETGVCKPLLRQFSEGYFPYPYPVLLDPVRYLRLSIMLWTRAAVVVLVGG